LFPLAGVAVASDLLLRSLLQLRMTCDIADLYATRIEPRHVPHIMHLYALALEGQDASPGETSADESLDGRLASGEEHVAAEVGSLLLSESILRNIVPLLSIAASPASSWSLTSRLGCSVRRFVTLRQAIHGELEAIRSECPACWEPLLEGIVTLLTTSGRPHGVESILLRELIAALTPEQRARLSRRLVVQ